MPIDATPSGWNGGGASTDFGNVSQVLPAYYLRFAVSQEPVPGHSTAMTEAAKTALAHDNAIATAKVLALTACDLLADPALVKAARADFVDRTT
jgi:aminobenzoyl-glutamate utilization protein B